MKIDNAEFLQLVSCIYQILHLADGAGRLSESPAVVEELLALVDLTRKQREAVDRLVSSVTGF